MKDYWYESVKIERITKQQMENEIIKIINRCGCSYVKIENDIILIAVHDLLVHDVTREIDDPIYQLYAGVYYECKDKFDLAEKQYLLAIKHNSDFAMNNLAYLYKKQGIFDSAETYYLTAIGCGNMRAMYNLAYMYYEQGKLDLAVKYSLMGANEYHVGCKKLLNTILDQSSYGKYAELLFRCYHHLNKKHLDRCNKIIHNTHHLTSEVYTKFICVGCKCDAWVTFEICGHSLCGNCHAGGCTLCK